MYRITLHEGSYKSKDLHLISVEISNNNGFPCDSVVKNPSANAGDVGSVLGLGISSGEGNGNPLWCSFLPGKSHGRGDWQAAVHGVPKE